MVFQSGWSRLAACAVLLVFVSSPLATGQGLPTHSLMGVGYYVNYDPNSWSAVRNQGQRLRWIITTSFVVADETGRLSGVHDPNIVQLVHQRGGRIQFRAANVLNGSWNRDVVHAVLTQRSAKNRLIADIVSMLESRGYDGVSIDFENVPPADRSALTAFVTELAGAVHARKKVLSLAVPAKAADDPAHDWSGAFDFAALGRASDWVIIMAYDEHWSSGPPGPVASAPWVEAVSQFAKSKIPLEKLVLGVALYGYDWPVRGAGEGISMREAIGRASRAGVDVQWNDEAAVPFYAVGDHTVYFEDARSVDRKLAIASRYGMAGVAFWRLGQELPSAWNIINAYLKTPLNAVASTH